MFFFNLFTKKHYAVALLFLLLYCSFVCTSGVFSCFNVLHFFLLCPTVPPVISSETEMYLAPVDSSVTLQCQADGFPPPSVTWHKDGQTLNESVRQRVLSSGSLQLAFVQPVDTGRYTCTAANAAGTVGLEMRLTVQSKMQYTLLVLLTSLQYWCV